MERHTKSHSEAGDLGLAIRAEWSTGPRTPAWDRLWRAILSDLGPEPAVAAPGHPTRENEGGQAAGGSSAPPVMEG
jgi:hypothetical protein